MMWYDDRLIWIDVTTRWLNIRLFAVRFTSPEAQSKLWLRLSALSLDLHSFCSFILNHRQSKIFSHTRANTHTGHGRTFSSSVKGHSTNFTFAYFASHEEYDSAVLCSSGTVLTAVWRSLEGKSNKNTAAEKHYRKCRIQILTESQDISTSKALSRHQEWSLTV